MQQDHILIGMVASYGRVLLVGWGFAVAATAPTARMLGTSFWEEGSRNAVLGSGKVEGKIKCCFVVL
jgi:hypothetical protein